MGDYFKLRLEDLKSEYDFVGYIRGKGLLLALDIVGDRETSRSLA